MLLSTFVGLGSCWRRKSSLFTVQSAFCYCLDPRLRRSICTVEPSGKLDHIQFLVYKPLPCAKSIRLLELFPSPHPTAIIECRLRDVQLDLCSIPYIALSYAWGPQDVPRVDIVCNEAVARVAPSLRAALLKLRKLSDQSQYIWADALCINQNESHEARAEKSIQVQRMDQSKFPTNNRRAFR
jgi:hypothetical protein